MRRKCVLGVLNLIARILRKNQCVKSASHIETMNPQSVKQIPANWDNYFEWLEMTPENFAQQYAYLDATAYLRLYSIPTPDLTLVPAPYNSKMGCQAVFHMNGLNFEISAIAMVFNPQFIITDMMHASLIPQNNGPLIPFIPSSRVPIKPKPVDLSDLKSSVGMILNGYPRRTRALMAGWQEKVPIGTIVHYTDGRYQLVESGNPFNRSGLWEIMET